MKNETLLPLKVSKSQVDASKKAKLASILYYAQEAAIKAVETDLGITPDKTNGRGLLWVVARYHFEIERLPELDEDINVLTWQSRMLAFFFIRNFEILNKDGYPFIKGSSCWSLIDMNNRQVILPGDYDIIVENHIRGDELPRPGKVNVKEGDKKAILHCYEKDLDRNNHMNNIVYLDRCVSLIPEEYLRSHTPISFDINYKKELRLNEETELSYYIDSNECGFSSEAFDLLIVFKETI